MILGTTLRRVYSFSLSFFRRFLSIIIALLGFAKDEAEGEAMPPSASDEVVPSGELESYWHDNASWHDIASSSPSNPYMLHNWRIFESVSIHFNLTNYQHCSSKLYKQMLKIIHLWMFLYPFLITQSGNFVKTSKICQFHQKLMNDSLPVKLFIFQEHLGFPVWYVLCSHVFHFLSLKYTYLTQYSLSLSLSSNSISLSAFAPARETRLCLYSWKRKSSTRI